MTIRLPLALLLPGLLAACGPTGPEGNPGAPSAAAALPAGISVTEAWARATPQGATVGAAYFTLRNSGPGSDVLLSVSSPVAERAELHRSSAEQGMSRMRPAGAVELGNGQSLVAEPGGLHVMLMGLRQPLVEGELVPLTLEFRDAGTMIVRVSVRPATSGALQGQSDGADHADHGHSAGHRRQRHVRA